MEQEDLINKHKLRSLYFSKRITDSLIIISAAVILISIFIYIAVFFFPIPRSGMWAAIYRETNFYNYMRYMFLPSWITPSAICIAIVTPIRIIVVRRFKIYTIIKFKKNYRHQTDLYKLKKTRDFQDLF